MFKMKKKSGKKWIMAAVTAAVCVMMACCGDAEGEVKSGQVSGEFFHIWVVCYV